MENHAGNNESIPDTGLPPPIIDYGLAPGDGSESWRVYGSLINTLLVSLFDAGFAVFAIFAACGARKIISDPGVTQFMLRVFLIVQTFIFLPFIWSCTAILCADLPDWKRVARAIRMGALLFPSITLFAVLKGFGWL